MSIQCGVDETDATLASLKTSLVDDSEDRTKSRRRRRCAIDQAEASINSYDVVGTVSADIGVATSLLCVVEAISAVWWRVVLEPRFDSRSLVARKVKDVAETTTRIDNGLTGFLRLSASGKSSNDVCTRDHLCGSDGRHIRAGSGERGVETTILARVVGTVGCDTLAAIACNTIIARAVEDRGTHETELHILITLSLLIERSEISLVVAV